MKLACLLLYLAQDAKHKEVHVTGKDRQWRLSTRMSGAFFIAYGRGYQGKGEVLVVAAGRCKHFGSTKKQITKE